MVLQKLDIGLARRFRWFVSVLSYTSWMQGRSLNYMLRPSDRSTVDSRYSTSYDPRQPIYKRTNDGPGLRCKAMSG